MMSPVVPEAAVPIVSFCLETPAEAAPTPPDAGRGSPARWFPDKN
jgi:hypothetical protein